MTFSQLKKGISNILIVLRYFSQGAEKRFSTTYNNYILQLNPNIFFPVLHFEKSLHLKNIFYDRCTQEVKVGFLTSEPCMHEYPHILLMLKRWWEGEGRSEGRERKEMCNKEKIQEWKTTDKKKNLHHLEKKNQNLKPELKQWCDVKMQRTITTK